MVIIIPQSRFLTIFSLALSSNADTLVWPHLCMKLGDSAMPFVEFAFFNWYILWVVLCRHQKNDTEKGCHWKPVKEMGERDSQGERDHLQLYVWEISSFSKLAYFPKHQQNILQFLLWLEETWINPIRTRSSKALELNLRNPIWVVIVSTARLSLKSASRERFQNRLPFVYTWRWCHCLAVPGVVIGLGPELWWMVPLTWTPREQ